MKMPLSRAALASTAALAAVLVPTGVASAASLTINDSRADTYFDDTSGDTETYTPAGSYLNTDLVRTTVHHNAKRVVVRAKYAELKRSGNALYFMFRVRTNEGLSRDAGVGNTAKASGTADFSKHNGTSVKCQGLAPAIDYDLNTVTLSIPRACLSNPRWVQVMAAAISIDTDTFHVWVDNGQDATSNEPKTWSAKVRRG